MGQDLHEQEKKLAAYKAAEYIKDGMTLGLGSGSTAYYLILRVGELMRAGMKLRAVASSNESERLAKELGIEIIDINDAKQIDIAIDGVDEIDGNFNAIKGGGGALFREKIIADMATEVIWIMDSRKKVDAIGQFPLAIEILPFGYKQILKRLEQVDLKGLLRRKNGEIFRTDNGNYIVDIKLEDSFDLQTVRSKLRSIVGVLEDGLFLNMCTRIIVGHENSVEILENK